jgi:D-3-phosphoglycerate dehydrogenase
MPVEITVPRLGWTMEEGTFVGWLKKDGEQVRAGEPLFTLDGDKALQEIEATDSGALRIPPDAPQPNSTVRVGDVLGYLLTEGESFVPKGGKGYQPAPSGDSPDQTGPAHGSIIDAQTRHDCPSVSVAGSRTATDESLVPPKRVPTISPRALRTAIELGMDWSKLTGSGRTGRIRERDVLAAATDPARPTGIPPVPHGKVAITDWTFPDLEIEEGILKHAGHEVLARQCKTEAELIGLCGNADVVVTQFARVNANVIAAMSKARAIVRYGIGVDNIDLEAARAHGIPVCNVPDYCIDEVADQTLAFILALTRQLVPHDTHVHSGKWGLATPLAGFQTLRDLTVGVVGFGRIGREVVRRLLPFKCRVLVFDPVVPAESVTAAGAKAAALLEVLAASDVLTLHCPSTPQTRKMLSAEALAQMKRGALFINVARGDLVDTPALVAALESGQLSGAALDVCDPEPIPADHPLLKMHNVVLAPHIASCSVKAVTKLRQTVAQLAAAALCGEAPRNVVNGVNRPRLFS